MERINTLINKLQQQVNNNETAQQLLYTAQLLVAELSQQQQVTEQGKVSVMMPNYYTDFTAAETHNQEITEPIKVVAEELPPIIENVKEEPSLVETTRIPPLPTLPNFEEKQVFNLIIDDEETAPTLALQDKKGNTAVNDAAQANNQQSINDVLKEDKKEVASTLIDTPVKDLRKAIGINDKYLFINELFNGDEAMYERSIKTINNFSVFPEAEQWIKRELYTKLCWPIDNETVKIFDQLVRRRFA